MNKCGAGAKVGRNQALQSPVKESLAPRPGKYCLGRSVPKRRCRQVRTEVVPLQADLPPFSFPAGLASTGAARWSLVMKQAVRK